MKIERETCTGCGSCVPYCPVEAIILHQRDKITKAKAFAEIIYDECVECAVCFRSKACPTDSIQKDDLTMPRLIRAFFSDPWFSHPGTDIPGRGTEEMKTNEVTGRFREGFVGLGLEFGRPGLGCRLKDVEPAIRKLIPLGVTLEPCNPLTEIIEDMVGGHIREDVRNEKVLSAIVEAVIPIEQCQAVFSAVKELSHEVQTVFSVGVICKVATDGGNPALVEMGKAGLEPSLNGKMNLGLGRPLFQSKASQIEVQP
jgi:NAD-dependent dihydropyrimidine dehydrogenase PreA subunit